MQNEIKKKIVQTCKLTVSLKSQVIGNMHSNMVRILCRFKHNLKEICTKDEQEEKKNKNDMLHKR